MYQFHQSGRVYHKRHTNIVTKDSRCGIDLADISKDAGSEPDTAEETTVPLVRVAIRCCRTVKGPGLLGQSVLCHFLEVVAVDDCTQWRLFVGRECGRWGLLEGVASVDAAFDVCIGFCRHGSFE